MIKTGMNEFVDVVTAIGPSKVTKANKIKNQPKYHPSQDFYKKFGNA